MRAACTDAPEPNHGPFNHVIREDGGRTCERKVDREGRAMFQIANPHEEFLPDIEGIAEGSDRSDRAPIQKARYPAPLSSYVVDAKGDECTHRNCEDSKSNGAWTEEGGGSEQRTCR